MDLKRVLVLVLLLAVLAGVGAWQVGWLATTPAPQPVPPKPPGPPRFQSAWATEEEWLVDRITRHVRELAVFAASGAVADPGAPPVKPGALQFDEHLFSPRAYEAVAKEALGSTAGRPAGAGRKSRGRPASHSAPRPAVGGPRARGALALEGPHRRAPRRGSARAGGAPPRQPSLFATARGARRTSDPRSCASRLTSLSLAPCEAKRATGLAGRFAETALVSLVGRERDALGRLDALEAAARTPAERAWVRALRLRNTGDWRIARDEKGLSLLERLEEFRALLGGQGDGEALAWLDRGRPEDMPDWSGIALDAYPLSVETANRFAEMAPVLYLMEAAEMRAALRGAALEREDPTAALNEQPGAARDQRRRRRAARGGAGLGAVG